MLRDPQQISRYERKFLVDQLDQHQVRAIVKRHPGMFIEPYPPRYVNNIYLDTLDMENYYDNVGGFMDRQKVRIRWYGELFGKIEKPLLEFKIKHGLAGNKIQYPFTPFIIGKGFSDAYFKKISRTADLPDHVKTYLRDVNIALLNCYYRWYFVTVDGKYRLTIDAKLTYHNANQLKNSFMHRQVDYNSIVVELKYQVEDENHAGKISAYFPFTVSKSSKYVMGIERVWGL